MHVVGDHALRGQAVCCLAAELWTLIISPAPHWPCLHSPEQLPEVQRAKALVALAATAPLPAGDSLVAEVYLPHLDIYQRLLIMDVLAGAAQVQLGRTCCAWAGRCDQHATVAVSDAACLL